MEDGGWRMADGSERVSEGKSARADLNAISPGPGKGRVLHTCHLKYDGDRLGVFIVPW